ncbi:MAG: hypothetical protein ACQESF_06865 [Nanobdellota archaeon]
MKKKKKEELDFTAIVIYIVLIMVLSFMIGMKAPALPDINTDKPFLKALVEKGEIINNEDKNTPGEKKAENEENNFASNSTETLNRKDDKIIGIKGPFKVKGISTILDNKKKEKFYLSWSYLNIEGKNYTNSFTTGYILNINQEIDELVINGQCKAEDGTNFKFRNLKEDVYKQDAFGEMNQLKSCSFFYLRNENPPLSRIRLAIIRPKNSVSEEIVMPDGIKYHGLKKEEYLVTFGFRLLNSLNDDKKFSCTLNLETKDDSLQKEFQLVYTNDKDK